MVVDDEVVARKGFIKQLGMFPFIEVAGEAGSQEAFFKLLEKTQPDMVFLDIMLRNKNILDYLANIRIRPLLVIVSAYSNYALKGFDLMAADYLLKPVSDQRLEQCLNKIKETIALKTEAGIRRSDQLYLKSNGKFYRIAPDDILFVKSLENYVVLHLDHKKLICKLSLMQLLKMLPAHKFIQVHRSYAVNIHRVDYIEKLNVYIKDVIIPISRDKKQETYRELMGATLNWEVLD